MGFFFLSRVIMGITGGIAVAASVGFASLVDITTTENRTRVIGLMNGCGVIVNIVGTTIGGLITGDGTEIPDFLPVFRISAYLSTIGIMYLIFVIPETLQKKPVSFGMVLEEWKSSLVTTSSKQGMIEMLKKQAVAFQHLPVILVVIQILGAASGVKTVFLGQYANYK
jgi:MFS family permease